MKSQKPLIFELSQPGRGTDNLPACDVPQWDGLVPANLLRSEAPALPEVSEPDVVRHFTGLSLRNFGVDSGAYPLGSCTMKYNPKINEEMARLPGFACVHPLQPQETVQGCLKLLWEMDRQLSEITGMERFTLQPAAGAHGEMTGLMIIKAYHDHNKEFGRKKIIIPDSAHGTNPASAAVAGFEVVSVPSDSNGMVDLQALAGVLNCETAGLMLTNPNTLGLFDSNIQKIADMVHAAGGLLYYDGANANAILGITRPGDMGFDVVHLNLHKSFSTPHGGGGPGSGPVGVKKELVPYLPHPMVEKKGVEYMLDDKRPLSIGRVRSFWGNFGVVVRAYTYLKRLGAEGLPEVAHNAVLNANYILNALKEDFDLPYDVDCMHEVVFSASRQKKSGVSALDIAKRLLDFGYHPPTIYFPLIVNEALMIEPTETESKESLDAFIAAMRQIAREAQDCPDDFKSAPQTTVVGRLDESRAARETILRYKP